MKKIQIPGNAVTDGADVTGSGYKKGGLESPQANGNMSHPSVGKNTGGVHGMEPSHKNMDMNSGSGGLGHGTDSSHYESDGNLSRGFSNEDSIPHMTPEKIQYEE